MNGTFGGGASDDRGLFDAAIGPWVNAGGGLVGCGWVVYVAPPANYGALMPTAGSGYFNGPQMETPVPTHPIGDGLTTFTATANYLPYGGTPKTGADVLLTDSTGTGTAFAWPQGDGRAVFLGLLYLDAYASYGNQSLTDGTNPMALELLIRSIEWAGHSL